MKHALKFWPAYLATVTKLDHARQRIVHIMEKEIPAVVPNYKLKPLEPEATTANPTITENALLQARSFVQIQEGKRDS